jgi:hypothetical protein
VVFTTLILTAKKTIMTKSLKQYITSSLLFIMAIGFFVSCEKSFDEKTAQQKEFENSSIVQVVVATMNAARNYIYVDTKPVNGSSLVTGSVFPATGYGFVVTPGLRAFLVRDTIRTATQVPLSFPASLQAGKHHTIFLYDTISSPKQKTVVDDIEIPADSTTRLRLANFVYAPFAIPAVDVFSHVLNKNIFTNVPVTEVTGFIPYMGFHTDTLYFRDAGTQTTHLKLTLSGGLTSKRSYTLVYRGSYRAVNGRTVTIMASR